MGNVLPKPCDMTLVMTCFSMVVTQVYWMMCRDFLQLSVLTVTKRTPQYEKDVDKVKRTLNNLKGYMKYVMINEVEAMQIISILQLDLKEQILERVEEVDELLEQIKKEEMDGNNSVLVFLQDFLNELR